MVVGPNPIPLKRLSIYLLVQAIDIAVKNPVMQQRAAELGTCIRAENGVANADAILEKMG
jgi:hypothetical protein